MKNNGDHHDEEISNIDVIKECPTSEDEDETPKNHSISRGSNNSAWEDTSISSSKRLMISSSVTTLNSVFGSRSLLDVIDQSDDQHENHSNSSFPKNNESASVFKGDESTFFPAINNTLNLSTHVVDRVEEEPGNAKGLLYSFLLWMVPLLPATVWISIPLSTHLNTSVPVQNFFMFSFIHHFIWFLLQNISGCLLFSFALHHLERPFLITQLFLCLVVSASCCAVDTLIWSFDNMPAETAGILFCLVSFVNGMAFCLSYFYFAKPPRRLSTNESLCEDPISYEIENLVNTVSRLFRIKRNPKTPGTTGIIKFQASIEYDKMFEEMKELSKMRRKLILKFVGLACLSSTAFLWCHCFVLLYFRYADTQADKIIFSIFFLFSLNMIERPTVMIVERIERDHRVDQREHFVAYVYWMAMIYFYSFYRIIFTNISTYYVFSLIQLGKAMTEVFVYPVRMSAFYYKYFAKFVNITHKIHRVGDGVALPIDKFRNRLYIRFYFVCMGQRISLTLFIISSALLYNSYNQDFHFVKERIQEGTVTQLMYFCLFMLAIEWTFSTILTIVIRIFYRVDILSIGGKELVSDKRFFVLCMILVVQAFISTVFSENRYNFQKL